MLTETIDVAKAITKMIALGRMLAENDMHCTGPFRQEDGTYAIYATFERPESWDDNARDGVESLKITITVKEDE